MSSPAEEAVLVGLALLIKGVHETKEATTGYFALFTW